MPPEYKANCVGLQLYHNLAMPLAYAYAYAHTCVVRVNLPGAFHFHSDPPLQHASQKKYNCPLPGFN